MLTPTRKKHKVVASDIFLDRLLHLDNRIQKAARTALRRMKENPYHQKLGTHPVKNAHQDGILSASVNRDVRIILRLSESYVILLYIDHHDAAYRWAEGVAVRWSAEEMTVSTDHPEEIKILQEEQTPSTGPFSEWPDAALLTLGVPKRMLGFVRSLPSLKSIDAEREELGDIICETLITALTGNQITLATPTKKERPSKALPDLSSIPESLLSKLPLDKRDKIAHCSNEDELIEFLAKDDTPRAVAEEILELLCGKPNETDTRIERDLEENKTTPFMSLDIEDLAEAEKYHRSQFNTWQLFISNQQRTIVEKSYAKPTRISGPPGTGKTVLALHRANWLAKVAERAGEFRNNPDTEILLIVYTYGLSQILQNQANQLTNNTPRQGRIHSVTLHQLARDLTDKSVDDRVTTIWESTWSTWAKNAPDRLLSLGKGYIKDEIDKIIKGFGIESIETYLKIPRRGRVFKFIESDRLAIWKLKETYDEALGNEKLIDHADLINMAIKKIQKNGSPDSIFSVVVDELQDFSPRDLELISLLAGSGRDRLFLAGDVCQSLYQPDFSLADVGIDVSGTAKRLQINYRNSRSIWRNALEVLENDKYKDWTGEEAIASHVESRDFEGAVTLDGAATDNEERLKIFDHIKRCIASNAPAETIAVLARSRKLLSPIKEILEREGIGWYEPGCQKPRGVCLSTMHAAKGMEFRIVILAGVSDFWMPFMCFAPDYEPEKNSVREKERRLLFVAMTRARDKIIITWRGNPSPFLEPLLQKA